MKKHLLILLFSMPTLLAADWATPQAISTTADAEVTGSAVFGTFDISTSQLFAGWQATYNTAPSPYYSIFTPTTNWMTPAPINTINNNEPLGDVVLAYMTSGPNANTVAAAFSDEQGPLLPHSYLYTSNWGSSEYQVSSINTGFSNVYIAFSPSNQTLYASFINFSGTAEPNLAYFDNNTSSWVGTPSLSTSSSSDATLTCDNSGNVFVAWSNSGVPYYAIYNGNWSSPLPISMSYNNGMQNRVYVAYNPNTNQVFAAWADGSRLFNYSIYSNGNWSSPMTVPGTDVEMDVFLACDTNTGKMYASWADKGHSSNPYYAVFNQGTWTIGPISTSLHAFPYVTLAFASTWNTMYAFWADASTSDPYASSLFISLAPDAPTALQGKKISNSFGTISEYFTILRWGASPTTNILGYHVYRDGGLVATLSPSTYSYKAHNLPKGPVVFTVAAFNSYGDSPPVSITIR